MMPTTKPTHLKGLRVVIMVHLRFVRSADLTRLFGQFAALQINIGVCAANFLSPRFIGAVPIVTRASCMGIPAVVAVAALEGPPLCSAGRAKAAAFFAKVAAFSARLLAAASAVYEMVAHLPLAFAPASLISRIAVTAAGAVLRLFVDFALAAKLFARIAEVTVLASGRSQTPITKHCFRVPFSIRMFVVEHIVTSS